MSTSDERAAFDPRRACGWPPRPQRTDTVRQIRPEELQGWIVHEDARLLVINKPGDVVCHPSKAGPWSSLVGAAREYTALPTMHLVFRLDRETSGVVVLAKDAAMASRLQTAMMDRRAGKVYTAILTGELRGTVRVDQPLGDDVASPVFIKSAVDPAGKPAVTHFEPVAWSGTGVPPVGLSASKNEHGHDARATGFTLAKVVTETGRKHQIRVHAHWLGHSLVGDKIYGPDDRLYLDFIDHGWTPALADKLLLPRQALHCAEIDLRAAGVDTVFHAPLAPDLREFCLSRGLPA